MPGIGTNLNSRERQSRQEGVPFLAHAGYELVHDADAGADKFIFRLAAELGDVRKRHALVVEGKKARAEATSRAAEELSPAPIGTSPCTRILAPLKGFPWR